MQNEEINSEKIITVINATLALYLTYLTIHIVILQFAWFLTKTNSRWRREARRTTADYNGIEEA